MSELALHLSSYLALATAAWTLICSLALGFGFLAWIRSLKTDLSVHAPLVDGPRRR